MSDITQFLEDLELQNPQLHSLVHHLTKLADATLVGASSQIKYGGVFYSIKGTPIAGIFPYSNHVSVEFSQGARFTDPKKILQGKGKFRRHLSVSSLDECEDEVIRKFLQQCME